MKTYVITISEKFPKTHIKAGQKTRFIDKIINKHKIHTIRSNYALWHKRFEEIDKGKACLSVRVWEGVAYKSKQREIFVFYKSDGIGLQKISFDSSIYSFKIEDVTEFNTTYELAKNDGLDLLNFEFWFKDYDLSEPMAIIHFTNFRY